MPGGRSEAESRPRDEWDALADANTAEDVDDAGRRITLDVALAHCQYAYGASWVCQPARWGAGADGTLDGCVPVRIAWASFSFLVAHDAIEALRVARGIGLAFATEDGAARAFQRAQDDAYPDEVSDG